MRTLLSATCLVALLALPLHADYRTLEVSAGQDKVLAKLEALAGPGKVFIFDLDSTLLDTRPRQVAILRAWAAREGKVELSGLCVEHFQSWDFRETLKRAGVKIGEIPALEKQIRKAWREGFWSPQNLVHDLPLAGASALVRRLHAKGAIVTYVGRRSTQEEGTRAALKRFGFPLDERALLLCDVVEKVEGGRKARAKAARAARAAVLTKAAGLGTVVACLENEGPKIDELRTRFPEAMGVHVRTDGPGFTQSRGAYLEGYLRTTDRAPRPGSNPDIPDPKTPLKVTGVPDGDTVKAETPQGERLTLRLIGIDTPEKDPLYERASMAGKKARHVTGYGKTLVDDPKAWVEAKTFLISLLDQGRLHLEYDPDNERSGHRDSTSSRRVLAYLFVVKPDGTRIDVNAQLCSQGYTLDYAFRYPHKRDKEFRKLIHAAKAAGLGYWAPKWQPNGPPPNATGPEKAPAKSPTSQPTPPKGPGEGDPPAPLEKEASKADLSHVKVGQEWIYDMDAGGTKLEMRYVVESVGPRSITYSTVTVVAGSSTRSPAMEWVIPEKVAEAPDPKGDVKIRHERIEIAGRTWETMVSEANGTSVWIPTKNGLPTFPPFVKMEGSSVKTVLREVK
jgi:endonuclease YncB( thermonuclease family)